MSSTSTPINAGTIAVIGAGITGITTAYNLAKRGCRVTIYDRHPYAAMETSFANGGQQDGTMTIAGAAVQAPVNQQAGIVFFGVSSSNTAQWTIAGTISVIEQ